MKLAAISASTWLAGEKFMQDALSAIVVLLGLAFFAVIFIILYSKKSKRTWLTLGLILVCSVCLAIFAGVKIKQFEEYASLSKNESARIRDRAKKPFTYHYNDNEAPLLRDIKSLNALPFYQQEDFVQRDLVKYLGKTEYIYYFRLKQTLYSININSEHVVFSDEITAPEYVGYIYTLNDLAFADLGFYPEIGPIFYKLVVPTQDIDKEYIKLDEKSEILIF